MPQSKEQRKKTAQTIQDNWNSLPLKEQLRQLDIRLGIGAGAQRQRARIAKRMAAADSIAQAAEKFK